MAITMKATLAFLTSCALTAGLIVGYLEHSAARKPSSGTLAPRVEKIAAPPSADKKGTAKSPVEKAPAPGLEPKAKAAAVPSPKEIAAARRRIEDSLLREDFKGASAAVEEILRKYQKNPEALRLLEALRREEKRIQAYEALVGPLEKRELPDPLYRVDLVSGGQFTAKSVKDSPSAWNFAHVLGGSTTILKDKVRSVTPFPRKEYLAERWKEIQDSVKSIKDPYDLFFFGVKKCFRDGLHKEGFQLMDQLLAMADSAHLVALRLQGDTVRSWEQAAGRQALEPLEPPAAEVASATEGGWKKGIPGSDPVDSSGQQESQEEDWSPQITRVRELLAEAEGLTKGSKPKTDDAFRARMLLQSAAKIISPVPLDDRVAQDLRHRVGILLERIMNESR